MIHQRILSKTPGLIVLFGSGEMSPTGRKIHEAIFNELNFSAPVRIGILETPTGFEVNAIHGWPERMEVFFKRSLKNFNPEVTRIRAWRKGGIYSTDDPAIVDAILSQDYLYCGAGSPGYAVRHLANSRAYENVVLAFKQGTALCLGSATAVAISRFAIPVYEIFKAGEDLHWLSGLDFFGPWIPNLVIVPHWNNKEGEDFDTTHSWLGKERYESLVSLLPEQCTILGIDEQTACVMDVVKQKMRVYGVGAAHVRTGGQEYVIKNGEFITFAQLSP